MRLVSVVMGSPSISAREDASAALLNYVFNFYQTRKLYDANATVLTLPVWKGAAESLNAKPEIISTRPRTATGVRLPVNVSATSESIADPETP